MTIQPYTAYAYEAANVMLDAIERASEEAGGEVPDRQAVVEQVFATEDYEGVLGTWSFDEDGDTSLTELSIQRGRERRVQAQPRTSTSPTCSSRMALVSMGTGLRGPGPHF